MWCRGGPRRNANRAYHYQKEKHGEQREERIVEIAHESGEPENSEQNHQGRSETAERRDDRSDDA